eukprot:4119688-Amphidinium_carterae.2
MKWWEAFGRQNLVSCRVVGLWIGLIGSQQCHYEPHVTSLCFTVLPGSYTVPQTWPTSLEDMGAGPQMLCGPEAGSFNVALTF